jgi:hypothetical protein
MATAVPSRRDANVTALVLRAGGGGSGAACASGVVATVSG